MTSPYGTPLSGAKKSSSSPYGTPLSGAKKTSSSTPYGIPALQGVDLPGFVQKPHGLGGLLSNLATGIEKTVTGTPTAAYRVIVDPAYQDIRHGPRSKQAKKARVTQKTIVKAAVSGVKDYYAPLAHGDWGGFADNVYDNPLEVVLDATTLASLGVGGAAKLAIIPAKGGKVLELEDAAGNVTRTKTLAKSELRARLQELSARARNAEIRVPGEENRVIRHKGRVVARQQAIEARRTARNNASPMARFNPALEKLSPEERMAVELRGRYDRPALNAEIKRLQKAAKDNPDGPAASQLKALTNRKVQKLFDKPSKAMDEFHPIAKEVGEAMQQHLNIAPDVAEKRRFAPAQQAHGAQRVGVDKPGVGDRVKLADGTTGKVSHVYDDGSGVEVRMQGGKTVTKGFDEVNNLDSQNFEWRGGPSIDELKARGLDPIYYPDTAELPKRPVAIEGHGGGIGEPQRTSNTRMNEGILRDLGQVIHDPATLGQAFSKSIQYVHKVDVHDRLLGMSQKSSFIPDGYVAVPGKGPYTAKTRAGFETWAKEHLDDQGNLTKADDFTTNVPDEDGLFNVVPKDVAKQLTGEFRAAAVLTRKLDRAPMSVWRALVLGLKPAWLTANMVGNSLMYLMRAGSAEDVMALAGAIRKSVKPGDYSEFDRLLDKHFAGQTRGGFTATQFPELRPKGRITKAGTKVTRALPSIDKRWDQALRTAKVKSLLKQHPQLRQIAEQMGRETAEFENLNLKGLEPTSVKVGGVDTAVGMSPQIRSIAKDYMKDAGLDYNPPRRYAKVDERRAEAIARAYDEMLDINDPRATPEYRRQVQESYRAFIDETKAQYDALVAKGYTFEFYPEGADPYPLGPRQAIEDLKQNKHLYVFPSDEGFGAGQVATPENVHPLLEDTGVTWNGKPVTANDMFRGVHDVFGHGKEGVGFRWDGEENAWRAHVAMYSDKAKPAMTSETRGQNSWVNFGPHGEKNRTASQVDTVYADQKAGILPEWAQKDGATDPAPTRENLLDEALSQHPEIVNEIYEKVNDALGSYDHLTWGEKNILRNVFPFYAWFRAISGVALKYTLDHPLAVNVMSQLANAAIDDEFARAGIDPANVPQSLWGLIITGVDPDGRVRGINTGPYNPYATVGQLADFVEAVATLDRGNIGKKAPGINPYLGLVIEMATGQTLQGYESRGFSPFEGVPQARLLSAIEAQYGIDIPGIRPAATKDPFYDHNIKDEALRFGGIPFVRVSPSAAKRVVDSQK